MSRNISGAVHIQLPAGAQHGTYVIVNGQLVPVARRSASVDSEYRPGPVLHSLRIGSKSKEREISPNRQPPRTDFERYTAELAELEKRLEDCRQKLEIHVDNMAAYERCVEQEDTANLRLGTLEGTPAQEWVHYWTANPDVYVSRKEFSEMKNVAREIRDLTEDQISRGKELKKWAKIVPGVKASIKTLRQDMKDLKREIQQCQCDMKKSRTADKKETGLRLKEQDRAWKEEHSKRKTDLADSMKRMRRMSLGRGETVLVDPKARGRRHSPPPALRRPNTGGYYVSSPRPAVGRGRRTGG